jgi:hypothetical protein
MITKILHQQISAVLIRVSVKSFVSANSDAESEKMIALYFLSVVALSLIAIYLRFVAKFKYFSKRGLIGPRPQIPFGNVKNSILKRRHIMYDVAEIYNEYKGKAPFVGFYNYTTPYLLILEPELMKQIMITNFRNFRNNEFSTLVSLIRCER